MPSRPNVVEYHGTPAYGYGPVARAVVSIARSDTERLIHRFTSGFEVSMVQQSLRTSLRAASLRLSASS